MQLIIYEPSGIFRKSLEQRVNESTRLSSQKKKYFFKKTAWTQLTSFKIILGFLFIINIWHSKKKNPYVYTSRPIFLLLCMIFGVRERNIYQDGTRIIPFCLGLVLEGEGYTVYLLCFLVPHLSGGQVSSSSVIWHICAQKYRLMGNSYWKGS